MTTVSSALTTADGKPSPSNPFIDASADQLLRVSAGLAFRRGRLRYVYQVLRGKDLETGEVSAEIREKQFRVLQEAQDAVLDLTNWHEFLRAVRRIRPESCRKRNDSVYLLKLLPNATLEDKRRGSSALDDPLLPYISLPV